MEATLTKWGNGQGIRLSKGLCDSLGIRIGDKLDIEQADDGIVVKPSKQKFHRTQKLSASDLFDAYSGAYEPPSDWPSMGAESDWGAPVGKEAW